MRQLRFGLGLAALGFAASASAQGAAGYVDGYYLPYMQATLSSDAGSADIEGEGWGIKGLFKLNDAIAFNGEYQSVNFDGDVDQDAYRLGAGLYGRYFGLVGEYINRQIEVAGSETEVDGGGVFLRTNLLAGYDVAFSGGVGYVNLDDRGETLDGVEFSAGLDFRILPGLGVFADYRGLRLKENGVDVDSDEARVGLRLIFGG